jgi:hypothetical protein
MWLQVKVFSTEQDGLVCILGHKSFTTLLSQRRTVLLFNKLLSVFGVVATTQQ